MNERAIENIIYNMNESYYPFKSNYNPILRDFISADMDLKVIYVESEYFEQDIQTLIYKNPLKQLTNFGKYLKSRFFIVNELDDFHITFLDHAGYVDFNKIK